MKVVDHLKQTEKTLFSFEILPPLKGSSIHSIFDGIDPLMEFKPAYINVTYHREEYVYKERGGGLLEKISIRKRPGTVGICAAIMNRYQVDAVPHIICGGFTKEETENALIDLQFLGIDNVLALRGDPIKTESSFVPNPEGHNYAVDLVRHISDMNRGDYLHEDIHLAPTDFCTGVAGYPEKHFEAMNLENDMKHLKAKIEAGAEYIVTQMFFDNKKYFEFVDTCRMHGIKVPIIPGLKPISTLRQQSFLPKFFNIDFPVELSRELEKCKSNADVFELGVEWGVQQTKELMEAGVPSLHFYTMGKSGSVKQIASQLF